MFLELQSQGTDRTGRSALSVMHQGIPKEFKEFLLQFKTQLHQYKNTRI
jgi:hypothetical protein